MKRRTDLMASAELLSAAAAELQALPADMVLFGSTATGNFYGMGGVKVYLPARAMGSLMLDDRGRSRDELLECVREAQRNERAFDQRVAAAFCFLPPELSDSVGVVRPGLFVTADVGDQDRAKLLRQALEAIEPGAAVADLDLDGLAQALSRAAPAGLFFGEPAGHAGLYGFWPAGWFEHPPEDGEAQAMGRCVLIARSMGAGEPAAESVLVERVELPSGP